MKRRHNLALEVRWTQEETVHSKPKRLDTVRYESGETSIACLHGRVEHEVACACCLKKAWVAL